MLDRFHAAILQLAASGGLAPTGMADALHATVEIQPGDMRSELLGHGPVAPHPAPGPG